MFNTYRVEICEQDYCIKCPSTDLTANGFNTSEGFGIETSLFIGHNRIDSLPNFQEEINPETLLLFATDILMVETQIVNWTEGAWNHSIIGQGSWDGQSSCHHKNNNMRKKETALLRFYPALLMPYYDAIPFSSFSDSEKRELFPNMMPALWKALSVMHHGDLNEDNLLIDRNLDKFHIVDPGIILSSPVSGNLYINDLFIFTTTPANYPLIPPFDNTISSRFSENQIELVKYLKKMRVSPGGFHRYQNPQNIFSRKKEKKRPTPADLLALGIMYFRILTGNDPFLGDTMLLTKPAWNGEFGESNHEIGNEYIRLIEILSDNYIENELQKYSIGKKERQLASLLLNLEINSEDHLLATLP